MRVLQFEWYTFALATWLLLSPSVQAVNSEDKSHFRRKRRLDNTSSAQAKKKPPTGPNGPKGQAVDAVVIGGGIAGHTAMWEMAQRGIGSPKNGIMLIEKNPNDFHVCGIIEPIELPESSGLNLSPFDPNYKPYRYTTHAMRINIATQIQIRCLANELKLPVYFTPWSTDFRLNGYVARSGAFEAGPHAPVTNALSARSLCKTGYRNRLYESSAKCDTNYGSADLVKQTSTTGIASVNLWNYDPNANYNQGDFDPVDEFYGWALGYSNYFNPTANYDGKGSTYNNASPYPFQPNNPSQDHPRHQCHVFKDLYSLYQYYVGPDYALFICQTNFGFLGDCYSGADPCAYLGSTTEEGQLFNGNLQYDEGYPVGSMTELCTRQKWLAQHNTKGVTTTYIKGEAVVSVDYNNKNSDTAKTGKYQVKTSTGRIVYTNAVIIAAEPSGIAKMTGNVIKNIVSQPQFDVPNPVAVVTVTFHWNAQSPGADWTNNILKTILGSYRMLNPGSCINRLDMANTPYHRNGAVHALRAVYNDNACIRNLVGLASIDDPSGTLNVKTGFPVNGALATEVLRELREVFMGGGPYSFYNITSIPIPDYVAYSHQPNSWYMFKTGSTYKIQEIADWATQPLGPNEKVTLAHQAWQGLFVGWVQSSVNITREGLLNLFPSKITRAEYDIKNSCNPKLPKEDFHVMYEKPCDPTKLLSEQVCDPSYLYSAPGVEKEWEYSNVLPNEHTPPYGWKEPISWQA